MSELNKKLLIHSLLFGLMLAGVQILIQLLIYIFNFNMFSIAFSAINGLLSMVIVTFFMAFASVKFRDKYLDHKISFLRCWMIGLIIGISAGLVNTLYSYIFNNFLDPGYIAQQLDKFKEMIESNERIPDENKADIIQRVTSRFTPVNMVVQGLMFISISALCLSLLATVFVRKKEKISETTIY